MYKVANLLIYLRVRSISPVGEEKSMVERICQISSSERKTKRLREDESGDSEGDRR